MSTSNHTSTSNHASLRRTPVLQVGTIIWLASEVMFFSALFGTYFTLRSVNLGSWPPPDADLETALAAAFTAVLVVSSATLHQAVRNVAAGRKRTFRLWLYATAVLAVLFLGNQAREWVAADFTPSSHAYGSAFFVLTGFHALHVAGGLIAFAVLLARSLDSRFTAADTPAVEVVSYYWHLVDVVWVAMFATLFLIR
jgi:cytochrome c oxidase subunit 3